jgi:hypothetical protein
MHGVSVCPPDRRGSSGQLSQALLDRGDRRPRQRRERFDDRSQDALERPKVRIAAIAEVRGLLRAGFVHREHEVDDTDLVAGRKPVVPDEPLRLPDADLLPADLLVQSGQIAFDCRPDFVKVDAEVVVDQDVAHPDDCAPGDLGVPALELGGEPATRLADDLEVVDDPDLNKGFAIERLAAGLRRS